MLHSSWAPTTRSGRPALGGRPRTNKQVGERSSHPTIKHALERLEVGLETARGSRPRELESAGKLDEAAAAYQQALELYEQKIVTFAGRTRERLAKLQ